jgi:hypothetical protein
MAAAVRPFRSADADPVATLLAAYMKEAFNIESSLAANAIRRDHGKHFSLMLAADASDFPVGFAAYQSRYDLHHGVSGAEICDLFLERNWRGDGTFIRLLAAVARAVKTAGGTFLMGQVLSDDPRRMKLAKRLTVGFPGEHVYLSGDTFELMAGNADQSARKLAKRLAR